uniref:Uncharacterized protein n=1 Tax=Ficedula albicollis TaxID=59894 RepID=U3JX08_FICAL
MSSDLDVFVGNTTLIDEEVYRLWLDGHSVAEAVARRLRGGVLEREGTSVAVLQSDTRDHYRTFQMLERLLHAPPRLLQQLLFQIPPERQALLVQRYYAFDEALARELLGKKLSKGTKKELDEVSARTGVGIRSCRRQVRPRTPSGAALKQGVGKWGRNPRDGGGNPKKWGRKS